MAPPPCSRLPLAATSRWPLCCSSSVQASPFGYSLGSLSGTYFPAGGHAFLGWGYGGEGVVSDRGARGNGWGHDPSASRASAGCLLCQGVFVPITVGSFLCQGVAPSMVGGRNGIMARLVSPTIISNHIAFPRPPINDFSYFITPFGLPCVSAQARVSQ